MKTCIWCLKSDVSFDKESHILPQNLSSKEICKDVCDGCNEFFGEKTGRLEPSIDIALKEMLVLSKYQKLNTYIQLQNQVGKEGTKQIFGKFIGKNDIQKLNRNTEFFLIEEKNGKIGFSITKAFQHHYYNPSLLTNRLKRGMFKVAFETAYNDGIFEDSYGSFLNPLFNYIREFVRWDKGNPKIYYLQRKYGAELTTVSFSINPKVLLHEVKNNYLEMEVLGHRFAFSLGQSNFTEHLFLRRHQRKDSIFIPKELVTFLDMDIFNTVYNR